MNAAAARMKNKLLVMLGLLTSATAVAQQTAQVRLGEPRVSSDAGSLGIWLVSLACCLPTPVLAANDCGVPKSTRPFEGLIDEAKLRQGDASVIHDVANKRVALVVSPNADRQLAWNESLRQPLTGLNRLATEMRGDTAQWEQANRETYDAKLIVDRIVAPFVAAAKQTKLMPDLAEFRDSGFEVAVVLDINFRCSNDLNFWGVTDVTNEIEVVAYPLSSSFVLGPVVTGRGSLRAKYAPGMPEVVRLRQDAINVRLAAARDFQANVERLYPARKSVGAPVPAEAQQTGDARSASAQARLQAVEELRRSGLISDQEAQAKRREILNSL